MQHSPCISTDVLVHPQSLRPIPNLEKCLRWKRALGPGTNSFPCRASLFSFVRCGGWVNGWKRVDSFACLEDGIQGWAGKEPWRSDWPPPASRRLTHSHVTGPGPAPQPFCRQGALLGRLLVPISSFCGTLGLKILLRIRLQTDFGIAALKSSM